MKLALNSSCSNLPQIKCTEYNYINDHVTKKEPKANIKNRTKMQTFRLNYFVLRQSVNGINRSLVTDVIQ